MQFCVQGGAFYFVRSVLQVMSSGRQAMPGVEHEILFSASLAHVRQVSVHSTQSGLAVPKASMGISSGTFFIGGGGGMGSGAAGATGGASLPESCAWSGGPTASAPTQRNSKEKRENEVMAAS
jgi:hypothetical protein